MRDLGPFALSRRSVPPAFILPVGFAPAACPTPVVDNSRAREIYARVSQSRAEVVCFHSTLEIPINCGRSRGCSFKGQWAAIPG